MNKLHPGARWIFRFNIYKSLIFLWFFFLIIALKLINQDQEGYFAPSIISSTSFFYFFIYLTLILIIIAEIYARLSYAFWKYEFSDNGIKIEKGIIWKKYSSVPYEKIQNIDIKRGILARIFGFSSIEIQTAGYSGFSNKRGQFHSEGYIPAISIATAEKIRDFLIKKIKHTSRNKQGL